ncbi:Toll-like receptor Tollo [Gryllus bimaculatus]|nr:Toll-like receptor Tollo [Gryllus bimaculatus]
MDAPAALALFGFRLLQCCNWRSARTGEALAAPPPSDRIARDAEHYAPTRGPLQCDGVLPFLRKTVEAACYSQWPEGSPLPTLSCAVASGYKRIAGTYLERFLYKATYQVMDTSISDPNIPGDWNGWCAYQTSLMIMKVESPDVISGLPIIEDDHMNRYTEVKDKTGTKLGASFPVMAQGFKDLILDFGPDGLGARVAWMSDYNCSGCASEVWHVEYWDAAEVARLLVNRAWRLRMRFSHAFMSPATFVLQLLREGALVREVAVHGGARWDDAVLFPVRLPRMRRLELASNVNFIRVPNLLHLNLANNKFTKIPEGLKYLQRLKYLDLSNNPIVDSEFATILCPLRDLKELNISGAPLGSLDILVSGNASCGGHTTNSSPANGSLYSRLEVLDASGCNLTSVASRLWARASNLRTLRLAANPLASVPAWLAQRLPALQELDLSGCLLAAPPALRLAPAQRLHRLLLARNLLATPRGALAAGDGAGDGAAYLDLSGNPLRGEWGAGAFAPLGARAAVNLSRTHLTALSPQMLRSLEPLAQVDLGGNPFDCSSCSILPLQDWLRNNTGPEVVWLGARSPVYCWRPLSLRGQSVRDVPGPAPATCASASAAASASWWTGGAIAGLASGAVLLGVAAAALLALRFRLHLTYHDRAWVVGELLPRLEGRAPRYRLCLHERDFPLGALVVQNIVECMERSRRTLIVLTPSFIKSQWCQWELEMVTRRVLEGAGRDFLVLVCAVSVCAVVPVGAGDCTHRLLEGAGRDFLMLVELQRLEARALPRLLRLLVETRTFLQWPADGAAGGCAEEHFQVFVKRSLIWIVLK